MMSRRRFAYFNCHTILLRRKIHSTKANVKEGECVVLRAPRYGILRHILFESLGCTRSDLHRERGGRGCPVGVVQLLNPINSINSRRMLQNHDR